MSEPQPVYATDECSYQLTEEERRIIEWLRRARNGSRHWMGTIRFVDGGHTQLFEMQPVGRITTQ